MLILENVYLGAMRVEGRAAATLAGEGSVEADDLIGGLVADAHVEGADIAAKEPDEEIREGLVGACSHL